MTVVFESSRFRIHITGKIAWLEMREPSGWVLREQLTIPVPIESLSSNAHSSVLTSAVTEYEKSRPGDTSLRAAITGYREPAIVRALPRLNPPTRTANVSSISRPRLAKPFWSREPLRPPLAIKQA